MPITQATPNVINFNKDIIINGVSAGKGSNATSTVFGLSALAGGPSGGANTAIGSIALSNATSGSFNTAVGNQALNGGNGSFNTAVGAAAGLGISGVNNTTSLGYGALSLSSSNYSNTTGLGYAAAVTGINQVQLGDSTTTTYVYGAVQNRSDVRDKTDIRDTQLGLDFLKSLRPVDFKWDMREDYRSKMPQPLNDDATEEEKEAYNIAFEEWKNQPKLSQIVHDGTHTRSRYHHGLIAQEVKAVLDAKGIDFGGYQDHSVKGGDDVLSIGYEELIAPMIKAIQELSAEVASLKAQLNP